MATQLDIYYLELHNLARANPAEYAASLGIDLNEGLPEGTIHPSPKQPLVFNDELKTMAVAHTQDQIDADFYGHDSPTTGETLDRFNASPYVYIKYGENISLVPTSSVQDDYAMALLMFESLFIDAGVDGRGHRKSILDDSFKEVGIGHLIGDWQGNTLTHVVTMCFGLSTLAAATVTGMLMQDLNSNGLYDLGEGIASTLIEVKEGDVVVDSTTTDSFGYYQIDLSPGDYTLVANTTDHDAIQGEVNVIVDNLKVDIFWDPVITDAPTIVLYSDKDAVQLYAKDTAFNSLNPVNIKSSVQTEYTLIWNVTNANLVLLDGVSVPSSGTKKVLATDAVKHTLEAFGPAGSFRTELPVYLSVFTPFADGIGPDDESGGGAWTAISSASDWPKGTVQPGNTPSLSGMHHLYGPSFEQDVPLKRPDELYTRIAVVERVSALSRELDIKFIDGIMPMTDLYRAECLFGCYNAPAEDDPEQVPVISTPTPSASVLGKGDRVAVIVDQDIYYVVSKLDRFEYPNNNRVAVYPDNAIYTHLSHFCVGAHFVEDGYSYADFMDPVTYLVTRIECDAPNLETNRIPRRLIRQLAFTHLQNLNIIRVDDNSWPLEAAGGGALPTQPVLINGTIRHKNMINNIPYVQDLEFGRASYEGDLSMYSPVLQSLEKASSHPLLEETIENFYSGATYFWMDDPDPEWVLVAAVFPAWDSTPYIKFLEVPVYGWSERARNDHEDEEILQDPETGKDLFENRVSYLRQDELVREISSITRSWIDWGTFENEAWYGEYLHRALCIPAKKLGVNYWSFAIHDGFGYSNGSEVYAFANELKLVFGHITRSIRSPEEGLASNGSPYEYNIVHGDVNSGTSNVSLWYDIDFIFYSDSEANDDQWESQHTTEECEKKTWIIYTNGDDQLFKKIWFDYKATGGYSGYPWIPDSYTWDLSNGITRIENRFKEFWYWNSLSNQIATYDYSYTYNLTGSDHEWRVTQSIPAIHYANIETGLFIMEIIEINCMNTLGPTAALIEGTRNRRFVVWYQGTQYTLFNVEIPYNIGTDMFPTLWNYWPFQEDANGVQRPEVGPYDIQLLASSNTEHRSIFFTQPFANYYLTPVSPYEYRAVSYPTMRGDVASVLFIACINPEEEDLKSDYIQVFIDPKTNSWGVTIKNILEIKDDRVLTFPDGGGDTSVWPHGTNTLFKIGDGVPSFNKPSPNKIVKL